MQQIPHTQMKYNLKEQNFRSLDHSPNAEVITSNYYSTPQQSFIKLHFGCRPHYYSMKA